MIPPIQFNLVDDPWIPVLTDENRCEEVGLRDVFEHGHTYHDIADNHPLFRAAMWRLLFGIRLAADTHQLSVTNYLDSHQHLFWAAHTNPEEHLFLSPETLDETVKTKEESLYPYYGDTIETLVATHGPGHTTSDERRQQEAALMRAQLTRLFADQGGGGGSYLNGWGAGRLTRVFISTSVAATIELNAKYALRTLGERALNDPVRCVWVWEASNRPVIPKALLPGGSKEAQLGTAFSTEGLGDTSGYWYYWEPAKAQSAVTHNWSSEVELYYCQGAGALHPLGEKQKLPSKAKLVVRIRDPHRWSPISKFFLWPLRVTLGPQEPRMTPTYSTPLPSSDAEPLDPWSSYQPSKKHDTVVRAAVGKQPEGLWSLAAAAVACVDMEASVAAALAPDGGTPLIAAEVLGATSDQRSSSAVTVRERFPVPAAVGTYQHLVMEYTSVRKKLDSALRALFANAGWDSAAIKSHSDRACSAFDMNANLVFRTRVMPCVQDPDPFTIPNEDNDPVHIWRRGLIRVLLSTLVSAKDSIPDKALGWQGYADAMDKAKLYAQPPAHRTVSDMARRQLYTTLSSVDNRPGVARDLLSAEDVTAAVRVLAREQLVGAEELPEDELYALAETARLAALWKRTHRTELNASIKSKLGEQLAAGKADKKRVTRDLHRALASIEEGVPVGDALAPLCTQLVGFPGEDIYTAAVAQRTGRRESLRVLLTTWAVQRARASTKPTDDEAAVPTE